MFPLMARISGFAGFENERGNGKKDGTEFFKLTNDAINNRKGDVNPRE